MPFGVTVYQCVDEAQDRDEVLLLRNLVQELQKQLCPDEDMNAILLNPGPKRSPVDRIRTTLVQDTLRLVGSFREYTQIKMSAADARALLEDMRSHIETLQHESQLLKISGLLPHLDQAAIDEYGPEPRKVMGEFTDLLLGHRNCSDEPFRTTLLETIRGLSWLRDPCQRLANQLENTGLVKGGTGWTTKQKMRSAIAEGLATILLLHRQGVVTTPTGQFVQVLKLCVCPVYCEPA